MESTLTLSLPRERLTVPVVRRLCAGMLKVVGVAESVVDDIGVAITEACTNVIAHADESSDYDVSVRLLPEQCQIAVTDRGGGFAHATVAGELGDHASEGGRGLMLMRALVDDVHFEAEPGCNTVRLSKRLTYAEASAGEELLRLTEPA